MATEGVWCLFRRRVQRGLDGAFAFQVGKTLDGFGAQTQDIAGPHRCADHHARREEDEILHDELAFNGEKQRVAVLEGDFGEQDQNEERSDHLQSKQGQNRPQGNFGQQADAHNDLEEPQHRDDPGRIEPIHGSSNEVCYGCHVEHLESAKPHKNDAK